MKKAIAIVEFSTVPAGIQAADTMAKTADIEIIEAQTVCPGKYLIIISGLLSAVNAAAEAARSSFGTQYISGFILGNPCESLFPALYGTTHVKTLHALGVLETFDAAAALSAADTAVKTALVELIEIRMAKGMCGKSYVTFTGEVAAVDAAINKARDTAAQAGMYLDSCVIANPDEKLNRFIL